MPELKQHKTLRPANPITSFRAASSHAVRRSPPPLLWSFQPRCSRRRPRPSRLLRLVRRRSRPPQLSPALQAEGELKYQWILQNYGSRLTDAEKQDVHRLVMEGQKPLAAFRAFPLDNADQPATVLKFTDAETAGEGSGK